MKVRKIKETVDLSKLDSTSKADFLDVVSATWRKLDDAKDNMIKLRSLIKLLLGEGKDVKSVLDGLDKLMHEVRDFLDILDNTDNWGVS